MLVVDDIAGLVFTSLGHIAPSAGWLWLGHDLFDDAYGGLHGVSDWTIHDAVSLLEFLSGHDFVSGV